MPVNENCLLGKASSMLSTEGDCCQSGRELCSSCGRRVLQNLSSLVFSLGKHFSMFAISSKRLLMGIDLSLPVMLLLGSCYFWPVSSESFVIAESGKEQ